MARAMSSSCVCLSPPASNTTTSAPRRMSPHVIHAIARAIVDPQFGHAASQRFRVPRISECQTIEPGLNACSGVTVFQSSKPSRKSLALDQFQHALHSDFIAGHRQPWFTGGDQPLASIQPDEVCVRASPPQPSPRLRRGKTRPPHGMQEVGGGRSRCIARIINPSCFPMPDELLREEPMLFPVAKRLNPSATQRCAPRPCRRWSPAWRRP